MQKKQHLRYHELEGCVKLLNQHQEFTEKVGSKKVSRGPAVMLVSLGWGCEQGLKRMAFQPQSPHRLRCGLDQ